MGIKEDLLLWFIRRLWLMVMASMVYKFFDKKSKGSGVNIEVKHNEKLAKELHKPIIRKFKKKEKFILDLEIIFGVLI